MKKFFLVLMMALMVGSLAACGRKAPRTLKMMCRMPQKTPQTMVRIPIPQSGQQQKQQMNNAKNLPSFGKRKIFLSVIIIQMFTLRCCSLEPLL